MKTLKRKYAQEIKDYVEVNGFHSYHRTALWLSEKHEKHIDIGQVHALMLDMKAEGALVFTPMKAGRPRKAPKICISMTTQQMCEKYGVKKITPKVASLIEADGWKKLKQDVFPFQVSYSKMV